MARFRLGRHAADGDGAGGAADARVVLYTRNGCHLCDVAYAVIEQVCAEEGEDFVAVDIDAEPVLRERFTDDVPVVSVDGALVARWRVSPETLRAALAG